jgi:ABC-2 type transport system ATP-binding protein
MAVIEVDGLRKVYGETVANAGLDFSVHSGEIFGYLGPNGAGKSTTIRMLMGFHRPTAGTARIFNVDVRSREAFRRTRGRIGFLPGDPAFDESVTGERFLDYQADLKGDERRCELLSHFDPPLDRKIREYSSGNRQMLGIVQAFMHDPDVIVMDEPTSGLDPLKQATFNRFLRAERDRGKTIFFSSHVLSEVRRVCDRVGVIRDGELVAVEEVEDLLHRGGKRVTVHATEPIARDDLPGEGVHEFERIGPEARFTYTGEYGTLLEALAPYTIVDLDVSDSPIEDVFMHFYGDADE